MKVPNKILEAIQKLASNYEITAAEREAIQKWASEGLDKRAKMAAEKAVES